MKNKFLTILSLALLSAPSANAATWDYAGTVADCGLGCSVFGIVNGDTVIGTISLEIGTPESGYVYNPPTDNYFLNIADTFFVDESVLPVSGTIATDALGDFISGDLVGAFSESSLLAGFGATGQIGLASGLFSIDSTVVGFIGNSYGTWTRVPEVVPLPAAAWLFISALGGLVVAKRKQLKG
jgi:hypothetical protein